MYDDYDEADLYNDPDWGRDEWGEWEKDRLAEDNEGDEEYTEDDYYDDQAAVLAEAEEYDRYAEARGLFCQDDYYGD